MLDFKAFSAIQVMPSLSVMKDLVSAFRDTGGSWALLEHNNLNKEVLIEENQKKD